MFTSFEAWAKLSSDFPNNVESEPDPHSDFEFVTTYSKHHICPILMLFTFGSILCSLFVQGIFSGLSNSLVSDI